MASTARRLSLRCKAEGSLERAAEPRLGSIPLDGPFATTPTLPPRCPTPRPPQVRQARLLCAGSARGRRRRVPAPARARGPRAARRRRSGGRAFCRAGRRRRRRGRLRGVRCGNQAPRRWREFCCPRRWRRARRASPTSARARSARCARGGRRRLAPFPTSPRIPGRRPVSTRRLVVFPRRRSCDSSRTHAGALAALRRAGARSAGTLALDGPSRRLLFSTSRCSRNRRGACPSHAIDATAKRRRGPVSYTHLTLPTILLV